MIDATKSYTNVEMFELVATELKSEGVTYELVESEVNAMQLDNLILIAKDRLENGTDIAVDLNKSLEEKRYTDYINIFFLGFLQQIPAPVVASYFDQCKSFILGKLKPNF